MKKAAVLFSFIAVVIFIAAVPALAQPITPSLPADYTEWAYTGTNGCYADEKNWYVVSSYGKVDEAAPVFEFIRKRILNGQVISVWHYKFDIALNSATGNNTYLYSTKTKVWTYIGAIGVQEGKVWKRFKEIVGERMPDMSADRLLLQCQYPEEKSENLLQDIRNKAKENLPK